MAVELATAYVSIVPTTRGITGAIAGQLGAPLQSASSKAGKDAGKRFSSGFKSTVGAIGVGALAVAAGKLIKDAVTLEAAYSKTMAQVAVATNAPKKGLQELDRLALKLGASTVFSANESAAAMLQLAKGGLTPAQIQAGALQNTLTLATAGELELADAANSVVQTMGAFQLGAKDTGAAVSALAGAANASSAEVSDITQALAQAGLEANSTGFSVQETTGILAAFADAGILGSDAGTSLKTALQRLVPQTDKARNAMLDLGLKFTNANGEFVSATQIAGRLQTAFADLSAKERTTALTTIFGSDARRAANVLIEQGDEGLGKYIRQTSNLNQAQKLANASMSGTAGALESMSGAVETAQLKLGRALAPTIQDLSGRLTRFLETAPIRQWSQNFIDAVTAIVRELTPLATDLYEIGRDALPILLDAGGLTVDLLQTMSGIIRPLVDAFSALPQPVRNLALAFGAALAVAPPLTRRLNSVGTSLSDMVLDLRTTPNMMGRVAGAARNLAGPAGLLGLVAASQQSNDAISVLGSAASGALIGFQAGGPIGAAIGAGAGGLIGLATALTGAGDSAEEAKPKFQEMASSLDQISGASTRATRALVAQDLQQQGVLDTARLMGIQAGDLTSAILGNEGAAARVSAAIEKYESGIDNLKSGYELVAVAGGGLQRVWVDHSDQIDEMRGNLDLVNGSLTEGEKKWTEEAAAVRETTAEVRGVTVDTQAYNAVMKRLPKAVRTQIQQLGIDVAKSDIFALAKQYKLTPVKVTTLIEALGWKLTYGNIVQLNRTYDLTPKQLVTTIKESGADLTARQVNDLFRDYDKLPPSIVTFLKQSGADGVLADVRRMRAGVNKELGDIDNEDIDLKIAAQTTSTLAKIAEFAPQMHATGGRIFGPGSGRSDSVPAWLSSGEFVIRESIARRIYPFLEALNAGQTEAFRAAGPGRFATGGRVSVDPHALTSGALSSVAAYARLVGGWAGGLATDIGTVISSVIEGLFAFGGNGQPLGIGGTLSWGQIAQGQQFAQSQAGKPYMWTGVGPYGFDCSGFVGAVLNAALGRYPYTRVGSTGTMPWSGSSPGVGRYTIGWFTGDPGHTSGNIGGLGVESAGGVGVQLGSAARSPLDSMFNGLMHYDVGGVLRPGYTLAYNGTGRNEIVARYAEGGKVKGLSDEFIVKVLKDVRDEFGGRGPMVKAIREWLEGLKKGDFSQRALKDEIAEFNAQQKKQLSQNVLGRLRDVFGSGSPVVASIQAWLDGLKKGEFSARALNKRLREVAFRNIDPAIRQFRVSGRQSRGETRSEIGELLGTLRQVLGRDAPVIKRVDRLGDRLVKVQARQDKTVARYQRANDKLDSIISAQNQFVRDVRAAFTHDAFSESETAGQARLQFRADRNDAQKALRQFRQLASKGLDAGIIKQLARSGNTALIAQLSRMTPKQIKAFERDLKGRNKATAALAEFTGNKVFGRQIRAQRHVVNQLSRSVNEWNRVIEKMERKVERATYEGTRRGIERGFKERDNRARRRRRAGAR